MGENLLCNGGFDINFREVDGQSSVVVADGWLPFWTEQDGDDEEWHNRKPEYKPARPYENRIHSGENAQQWFNFYGTNDRSGIYQAAYLSGNGLLTIEGWVQVWSSSDDEPVSGGPQGDGNVRVMIGVDMDAGEDPCGEGIVWSDPIVAYDEWKYISMAGLVPTGEEVTVFLVSVSEYAVKHNDVYWDDVSLTQEIDEPPAPPDEGLVGQIHTIAQHLRAGAQMLETETDAIEGIAAVLADVDRTAEKLADLL